MAVKYESDEELIEKINRELQYNKFVPEKMVSNARYLVMGGVTEAISKNKAEYTMESFAEAFGGLFYDLKVRKYIPINRKVDLPEKPMEQTFVKQLQGVGALHNNDLKEVVRLTEQKLRFENNYNAANSAFGTLIQRQFEENMHTEWNNIFVRKNRNVNFLSGEEHIRDAGLEVLDEVKGVRLKYDQDDIGPAESNGCFYHFSDGDQPQIGWRVDWETLYNGKEWTTD